MLHPFRPAAAVATLAMLCVPAAAKAAGQTMVVSATVVESCSMDVAPMQFGTLASDKAAGTAQSRIAIECSPDTRYAVSLDGGLHAQGEDRRMVNESGTATIAYRIYRDAAGTQPWGAGEAVAGTASASRAELTAYARTDGASVPPGNYRDVVTVTLSF